MLSPSGRRSAALLFALSMAALSTRSPAHEPPAGAANQAPQFTTEAPSIAVLDRDYRYTPGSTDADGDTVSLSLVEAPAGMALAGDPATLQWRPTSADLGLQSVRLRAQDPHGAFSEQVFDLRTLQAFCPIYPIAIPQSQLQGRQPGQLIEQMPRASGAGGFSWLSWSGAVDAPTLAVSLRAPGDSYTYRNPDAADDAVPSIGDWVPSAPGSMNAQAIRERLDALAQTDIVVPVWDSQRGQGNRLDYRIQRFISIRLRDYRLTGNGWISFEYRGEARCYNRAPVAQSQQLQTREDTELAIALQASDPDGDRLQLRLLDGPEHGELSGEGAELRYTPAADYHGHDRLRFLASDGELESAPATVDIDILPVNDAPVAQAQTLQTDEDTALPIRWEGVDADGDALNYYLVDPPTHGQLEGAGQDWTYRPDPDFAGNDSLSFKVSDGVAVSESAHLSISIRPVNDAPVAVEQTIVTDRDIPIALSLGASDPERDPLTYRIVTQPTHGVLTGAANDLLYSPEAGFHGSDRIEFVANDGLLDSAPAVVAITVNQRNAQPRIVSIPLTTAVEGQAYRYPVQATDADGDTLAYRLSESPAGMTIDAVSGMVEWIPATQATSAAVVVRVEDGAGGSDEQGFTISVDGAAGPKIVSEPITRTDIGNAPRNTSLNGIVRDFDDTHADFERYGAGWPTQGLLHGALGPDGRPVSARWGTSGGFTSAQSFEQWYTNVPGVNLAAPLSIEFTRLDDGRYFFDGSQFFPIDNQLLGNQGRDHNYHFTTEFHSTFQYLGGEVFSFYGDDDLWIYIDGRMAVDLGGVHPAAFGSIALDSLGLELGREYRFDLYFAERHTSHSTLKAATSIGFGQTRRYVYQVDVEPADSALQFSLTKAPDGMIIDPENGLITWAPENGDVGVHDILVRVSDGSAHYAEQAYSLEVIDSPASQNHSPQILSLPDQHAEVGQPYRYDVQAVDSDGDALTYSLSSAPSGMSIDPATGLIEWLPDHQGVVEIDLRASDSQGAHAVQRYFLSVESIANGSPDITSVPPSQAKAGRTFRYAASAQDPEGDAVNWSLVEAPAGMRVDAATGLIEWTPETAGRFAVTLRAADALAYSEQGWDIDVVAADVALSASVSITPQPASPGSDVSLSLAVSGAAGPVVIVATLDGEQLALPANQPITLVAPATPGAHPLRIEVDDGYERVVIEQSLDVGDPSDNVAPQVRILSPADDSMRDTVDVTAPVDVRGSVQGDDIARWVLAVQARGASVARTLAEGEQAFDERVIAAFDPTLLLNGQYTLVLQAWDHSGNQASDSRVLLVDGDMKLGHFSISFEEVSIPVAGIPVTVTRTYDTRRAQEALDFGYGWSVDANNVRLQESRRPGFGWDIHETGTLTSGQRCFLPNGDPIVSVTLPDGELARFKAKASPECQSLFDPNNQVQLVFEAIDGTDYTLEQLDYSHLVIKTVAGSAERNLTEYGAEAGEPVDPQHYRLTSPEGLIYEIDQAAGLRRVDDPASGQSLSFSRDGVLHSSGVGIRFVRDPQGRIDSVELPDGQQLRYAYDPRGDLTSVTDPVAANTGFTYLDDPRFPHYLQDIVDPRGVRVSRNEYGDDGRLLATVDADGHRIVYDHDLRGRTSIVKDRRGNATAYVYDDHGRVLSETRLALGETVYRSYDDDGNVLSETGPAGRTTRWTYDARGNRLTETNAAGESTTSTYNSRNQLLSQVDALGRTVLSQRYDDRSQLLLIASQDALGQETGFGYVGGTGIFGTGQLAAITDPSGAVTRFDYDFHGFRNQEIDALGKSTYYVPDDMGRVREEQRSRTRADGSIETLITRYTLDAKGQVTAITHPDGSVTTTEYDGNGKPIRECDGLGRCTDTEYNARGEVARITYADGSSEHKAYDPNGNLIAQTDRNGQVTRHVYDAANRMLETIHPDDTPGDDADNPRSRSVYDAAGQLVASIDEAGQTTRYEYDAAGRRILTVLPAVDGVTSELRDEYDAAGRRMASIDAKGRRTEFRYDNSGRLTETEFANGSTTNTEYDAAGRKTATIAPDGQRREFSYDQLSRLTEVRQHIDGRILRTRYVYDELGNKIEQIDAMGRSTRWEYDVMGRETARILPEGQRETKSYNVAGELTEAVDFNGTTIRYTYDLVNRLTQIDYIAPGGTTPGRSETFDYDANGRRTRMASPEGVTTWTYDVQGRVVQEVQPTGAVIAYGYDAKGNRTLTRHTQGSQVTENYYNFDALNRLESAQEGVGEPTVYSYDANGNLAEELQGVTRTAYRYDVLNRLNEMHSTANAITTQRYVYTLDAAGRRTRIEETDSAGHARVTDYGYDALGRLISEIETVNGSEVHRSVYAYDDVGNRVSKTEDGDTETAIFDDNDRLFSQGNETYDYDANGNQTRKTDGGGQTDYRYDLRSKLIGVSQVGQTVEFDYDADGNRLARRLIGSGGTVDTRFVIDRSFGLPEVIAEIDSDNAITQRYLHGYQLIQQTEIEGQNSVLRYPLRDGLGSTRYLVDELGSVTDAIRFTPWGETREKSGDSIITHRFAGEYWEDGVGLSYNRARWLDPSAGRFTQADRFRGFTGDPASLNHYGYVHGNPATGIDPTGYLLEQEGIGQSLQAQLVASSLANIARSAGAQAMRTMVGRHVFRYLARAALASASAAVLIKVMVEDCVRGRKDCDYDMPILSHGAELQGHAWHINDSLAGEGSNDRPTDQLLNARVAVRDPDWGNPWYDFTPHCGLSARLAFGGPSTCDEYPFASTSQGGVTNYTLGRVSLRLLPLWEQTIQARLIGAFYRGAAIVPDGTSEFSQFYSMASPLLPSFYITRQGRVVFPLQGK